MKSAAQLSVTEADDIPVAALDGEVDMSNAQAVRESLLDAVTNHAPGLVLDLSQTTYLDSAGVQLVFELARRLHARQQGLRVVVPAGAPIRRILTLTNVSAVAPMHGERDGAVVELNASVSALRDGSGNP